MVYFFQRESCGNVTIGPHQNDQVVDFAVGWQLGEAADDRDRSGARRRLIMRNRSHFAYAKLMPDVMIGCIGECQRVISHAQQRKAVAQNLVQENVSACPVNHARLRHPTSVVLVV